jgi:hypothetical protein
VFDSRGGTAVSAVMFFRLLARRPDEVERPIGTSWKYGVTAVILPATSLRVSAVKSFRQQEIGCAALLMPNGVHEIDSHFFPESLADLKNVVFQENCCFQSVGDIALLIGYNPRLDGLSTSVAVDSELGCDKMPLSRLSISGHIRNVRDG